MLDLRKVNKEQKKAIIHEKGPLIVDAGPGTGKTAVITKKIAFLIEKGIKPEEILALTFTDKAANEMEERVEKLISFGFYHEFWISTFHSFAEKITRNHSLDIGISPDFKIIEEINSWILLKKNIDSFNLKYYRPLNNPTKFISGMITFFNRLKDDLISPEDFIRFAKNKNQRTKKSNNP